jgi:hypothetical protein
VPSVREGRSESSNSTVWVSTLTPSPRLVRPVRRRGVGRRKSIIGHLGCTETLPHTCCYRHRGSLGPRAASLGLTPRTPRPREGGVSPSGPKQPATLPLPGQTSAQVGMGQEVVSPLPRGRGLDALETSSSPGQTSAQVGRWSEDSPSPGLIPRTPTLGWGCFIIWTKTAPKTLPLPGQTSAQVGRGQEEV